MPRQIPDETSIDLIRAEPVDGARWAGKDWRQVTRSMVRGSAISDMVEQPLRPICFGITGSYVMIG